MAIRKFLNKYWGWTFLLIPLALQAIFFYKLSSFTFQWYKVLSIV